MPQKRRPARVCSRIGFGLFAAMLAMQFIGVAAMVILRMYRIDVLGSLWSVMLVSDGALYLIGVPLFLLITAFVPSAPRIKSPRFRFHAGHYLLAVVVMFGVGYALTRVTGLLTEGLQMLVPSGGAVEGLLGLPAAGDPLSTLFFMAVVPAFGEEFVFRYMLRRKMGECGDRSYVFLSALTFALFHANLSQLFFAFALGALFAWLYAATGRLWVPISLHFIYNATNALVFPALRVETRGNPLAALALAVFLLLLVAAGITLFFVFRKWALATMRPPTEPGWPHKPPRWLPAWRWKREMNRRWQAPSAPPPPMPVPWPGIQPPAGGYAAPARPSTLPYNMAVAPPPPMPVPWPGIQPPAGGYAAPARPSTLPYNVAVAPPQPYGAAMRPPFPPLYAPKPRSARSVCIGNPGMIVYISVSGVLVLASLLGNILLPLFS